MAGSSSVRFGANWFLLCVLFVAAPLADARAGVLSEAGVSLVQPIAIDRTGGASPDDPASGLPVLRFATPSLGDNEATPPDEQETARPDATRPGVDANAPLPTVEYDLAKLPEPVRAMRARIIEAAKTGSIEALRPLIGSGATQTEFGGDGTTDPIAFLKSLSGDEDGREVLAILLDVLDSGYVHLGEGTENDVYAWPYFFAYPLDRLTPAQMVELFRIVTAGDYDEMRGYGAYIFYRVGITPDGKWRFFVTGE
jgi:hypothetical protein